MWAAIQDMERKGCFLFEFHWKARNEVALNRLCDIVAGNARVTLRDMTVQGASRSLLCYVYDTNVVDDLALSELLRP